MTWCTITVRNVVPAALGRGVLGLAFVAVCAASSCRSGDGATEDLPVVIGRLTADLEVLDRNGERRILDVDLDGMVREELGRARSLELADATGPAIRTSRLRVYAHLAPDGATGQLHTAVSAQIDQGETVPLAWDVTSVAPASGVPSIPDEVYEDALRRALAEALGALDRQARVIRRDPAGLVDALEVPDPPVRVAAADVLGHRRHRPAVDALCRLLADSDDRVFEAALRALVAIRDQRAVPCITRHASGGSRRLERVIEATSELGGNESMAFLAAVASDHDSPRVRGLARAGAKRIEGRAASSRGEDHDHEHETAAETSPETGFIKALSDPDREVRIGATRVVAERGTREAVEPLCVLLGHEDAETVAAALAALAAIRDDRAVPCLVRWAGDDEARLAIIIDALAAMGGPNALSVLDLLASEHAAATIRQLAREAAVQARARTTPGAARER
jgi:hypothetical protein